MSAEGIATLDVAEPSVGPAGAFTAPLPEWVALLREAAVAATGTPIAILLPDTTLAGEIAALLCARNAPARRASKVLSSMSAGDRVRVLPKEGVYDFVGAGEGGYWLQLRDKKNRESEGRLWIPPRDATRLQPTRRKAPLGSANRQQWAPLSPTAWDKFSGSPLYGNAALSHLTVVLIGARAEFMAALGATGFSGATGEPGLSVASGLPWGSVEEGGELELLQPEAASGEPLVALARDHISARRLAAKFPPKSLIFISTRAEDALNDRTSVELLAERHTCLVIAPGRLRDGFAQRREDGWSVAELSGSAILNAQPTGIRSLDRISEASGWMRRPPASLAQRSCELEEAFHLLDAFGRAAEPHLEQDDDIAEAARLLRQSFFEASDWLGAPSQEDLAELATIRDEILKLSPRLRSIAGEGAADSARAIVATLELFAKEARGKAMTPKGECLLTLADKAHSGATFNQVIVTGHRRTAAAVGVFLDMAGTPMQCLTPTELAGLSDVRRVNVLSVMRREAFMRLVDPWPAPDLMFLGYQHEVDIYRQRLTGRQRLIDRLRPDEATVRRVPRLAVAASQPKVVPSKPEPPLRDPFAPLPRPVRRPQVSAGELARPARYCSFAGHSWMAITDDHTVARVATVRGQKAQVAGALARDLQAGDLILVREGGDKDILREMAEQIAGAETYARQRHEADLWRRKLRATGLAVERLRQLLAEEGLERAISTLRYWICREGPIGPNDPDASLPLIAIAIGENPEGKEWKSCLAAVHAMWKLHVTAGFRLTSVLMQECGEAIFDHSEHETALELNFGTVWLLEIEQIGAERRPWPYTQVNRIQWELDAWKRRLLRESSRKIVDDAACLLKELGPEFAREDEVQWRG